MRRYGEQGGNRFLDCARNDGIRL